MVVISSDTIRILGKEYIIERVEDSLVVDCTAKSPINIKRGSQLWRVDLDTIYGLDDLLLSGLNGQVFDSRKNVLYFIINGITLQTKLSFKAEQRVIEDEDEISFEGDIFNNKIDIYDHLEEKLKTLFQDKGELKQDDLIERCALVYGIGPTQYYWQSEAKKNHKRLYHGDTSIVPIRISNYKIALYMRSLTLETYISQFERKIINDIPREQLENSEELKYHAFTIKFLRDYFNDRNNPDIFTGNIAAVQRYIRNLSKGIRELIKQRSAKE
ncbi:hypothetical protein J4232_03545 [Candidatus Woesearchaeota archaeon]|nr:hypothetical protein [Candidatus Woesearchaeota archaeon]